MKSIDKHKRRRLLAVVGILIGLVGFGLSIGNQSWAEVANLWRDFINYDLGIGEDFNPDIDSLALLEKLEVKGRAPKTGYSRELFAAQWQVVDGCSARNLILKRDLKDVVMSEDCKVKSGTLHDPYSGEVIEFVYGPATSQAVQIDHIVAVSDAWQKGAQSWDASRRSQFYNDPVNLLAVDGKTNQQKSDQDAASWLPPNKAFRCEYVARQVQVKTKYNLWVTEAEKTTISKVLQRCRAPIKEIIDN